MYHNENHMKSDWMETKAQLCYITISLAGLLLLTINLNSSAYSLERLINQSFITVGLFISICLAGIIVAAYPQSFSKPTRKNVTDFEGHHPICGHFKTHVLNYSGKVLCAGCTGLMTGATLAILCSLLYLKIGAFSNTPVTIFWIGFAFIGLGLIQHFIDMGSPIIHFLLNVVYVLGAAFLHFSLNSLEVSLWVEGYLLAMILFWIITRIRLSQYEHVKICALCDLKCKFSFFNE
jgi:hypothetical protein